VGDLTGQPVGGVPEFSFTTAATYTHDFDNGSNLIGRIDYQRSSTVDINNGLPTFNVTFGNEEIFTREIDLVNASLTYVLDNGIQASVFARNLFDNDIQTGAFDGVAQGGTVSGFRNNPRTFGGTLRYKF